ncbi:hypothetical protein SISNIDRAFT_484947 [Sistotremastrum niveocremeum HHB9708]|uniref:Protein kinase domain-containing protein n=1 Tax=Sistotremastrum niveocremeum HHB9708 TaxID=1314777 RepID=A0A164VAT2_9AGAM|nr:hypothetical protein SISNIDRAFT_484947 [Sistotremastrum niveocremeum HHB9708]
MYIFESSIATDNKLTTVVRGMAALSLKLESQRAMTIGERGKLDMDQLDFGEEIARVEKKAYVLRIEHGRMLNLTGGRKAVILRRFEMKPEVEDQDSGLEEFKKEVEFRGDLLNRHFARMLGVASSNTGRTKMIVVEAGTISAYDYVQHLSGLEYPLEYSRIMCEFVAGYRYLWEHRGSWRGGYHELLLSAKEKRLCIGGLGRIDGQWEDSGWRMEEASLRLRNGNDWSGGGSRSFEENADEFERVREAVTKWNEEKTEENAHDLFDWLSWWSGSSEFTQRTENSPSVGEIGWREGNVWHPVPLVHQVPLSRLPEYDIAASQWRDGEWDMIAGTQIGGYSRWSTDISSGEEINIRTIVRSYRTNEILDFFYGSVLSLAKVVGVDVCSLQLVSQLVLVADASLATSDEQTSTVYYFAYPPNPNGSVSDPPGFWSFSPYPYFSDQHLQADAAEVRFHVEPFVHYQRANDRILPLLQDLDSHGFLPIPDITYTSESPFASIREVTSQQALESTIALCGKKRQGKNFFSIFSKKRKVSNL